MHRDSAVLLLLSVIVLFSLAFFFAMALSYDDSKARELCKAYSCPDYSSYVGSRESNVFHSCACSYAERIKPENIVCFMNSSEAIRRGYREAEAC